MDCEVTMRKTLVIASLALGTAAMAAQMAPADGRHSTALKSKQDLSRQNPVSTEVPTAAPKDAPAARTDYDYENLVVGTSRYDYQHNGSYGKMIAISSDGVAHGAFMGGANITTGRRVLAWCATPDMTMPSPATNVTDTRAGYITVASTSAAPGNGLPANSSVVGFHTAAGSWVGVDFDGCTMAFNLLQNTENINILWPHVAVDYQDRMHITCGDGSTSGATVDYVYYNATTDGATWDGTFATAIPNSNTLSETMTAAKHAPGVALLVMPDAPAAPDIFGDATYGASQWHHDICLYEARDANNDLFAQIEAGNLINITKYHDPESTAPFRHGCFAYADVDAIYDSQETPDLHVAFGTPASFADTMMYHEVGNDTLFVTPYSNVDSWHSSLWHNNVTQGDWGHIAGWLTGTDENDVPADSMYTGVFRNGKDRVQLAHDPATGYLYALWNQYSFDDVRARGTDGKRMANGELYMSCSTDNGNTWGPHINLTNTPSPECASPNCLSETFGSLAETVSDGYLHVTFMLDKHAGSSIRTADANDGSLETVNDYFYMRVPVASIPPAAGTPWDAAGHVGLGSYKRSWYFTNGHLDTVQMVDRVVIFNEGRNPVHLNNVTMYHDALDVFGDANSNLFVNWEVMGGDPVEPGEWIENPTSGVDWDGLIPAQTPVVTHFSVGHRGLPMAQQIFKLSFDDGTVRYYRFIYQGAQGVGSLVVELDVENLENYAATVLYERGSDVEPGTTPRDFALSQNVPNPFNPVTEITFDMVKAGPASLKVYNLMGAVVATLVDGPLASGNHTVAFDGSQLSSGVYFYTLQAAGRSETRKMLLTK
jgi:hypothetical protein